MDANKYTPSKYFIPARVNRGYGGGGEGEKKLTKKGEEERGKKNQGGALISPPPSPGSAIEIQGRRKKNSTKGEKGKKKMEKPV